MIDWTNSPFRFLMRLIAPFALLYTEMQTPPAITHKPERALGFHPEEKPLALQLGGADIKDLVFSAIKAEERGFTEVNLNLGCPSDRVQAGRFGACLMAEPLHVAACIRALKAAVTIPVTAKTRIGIDSQDSYVFFSSFVKVLVEAGCDKLIVHARKAWLKGLNPKQNRTIPPLHYDYVYRIKQEIPTLPIIINGNIKTIDEIKQHMQEVDGVMLGRLACQNPYALAAIHQYFFPETPIQTRETILMDYLKFMKAQFAQAVPLSLLVKPILNMSHGFANAKRWKEGLLLIQQSKNIDNLESVILKTI
jgi:tRNA-dihydrouridine synthase A